MLDDPRNEFGHDYKDHELYFILNGKKETIKSIQQRCNNCNVIRTSSFKTILTCEEEQIKKLLE